MMPSLGPGQKISSLQRSGHLNVHYFPHLGVDGQLYILQNIPLLMLFTD